MGLFWPSASSIVGVLACVRACAIVALASVLTVVCFCLLLLLLLLLLLSLLLLLLLLLLRAPCERTGTPS